MSPWFGMMKSYVAKKINALAYLTYLLKVTIDLTHGWTTLSKISFVKRKQKQTTTTTVKQTQDSF